MTVKSSVPPLFDNCIDPKERDAVEFEFLRLVAHCVEVLIKYGLHAKREEMLWESPTDDGSKRIYRYTYKEDDFVRIGHEIASRSDVPNRHQIAGMAATILTEDLLPALAEPNPTWKLTSWSLLLSSLIPDISAATEKSDRLASLLEEAKPFADIGRKSQHGASKGGKARSEKFTKFRNECVNHASEIHARNPKLSINAVAANIAKSQGGSEDEVRRNTDRIRKHISGLW